MADIDFGAWGQSYWSSGGRGRARCCSNHRGVCASLVVLLILSIAGAVVSGVLCGLMGICTSTAGTRSYSCRLSDLNIMLKHECQLTCDNDCSNSSVSGWPNCNTFSTLNNTVFGNFSDYSQINVDPSSINSTCYQSCSVGSSHGNSTCDYACDTAVYITYDFLIDISTANTADRRVIAANVPGLTSSQTSLTSRLISKLLPSMSTSNLYHDNDHYDCTVNNVADLPTVDSAIRIVD